MDKRALKIAFIGDSLTEGTVGASYFDILRSQMPQHALFNYGKGGDTVISLNRRLNKIGLDGPMDLGFVWVGVNDVFVKTSWFFPIRKRLRRQPWARNHTQFQESYHTLLTFLHKKVSRIYTIPPLFIGEDMDNVWNRELTALSKIIKDVSDPFADVDFLNLREHFMLELASKTNPPHIPVSVFRGLREIIFPTPLEKSEKEAAARGLQYTIDGVHLNKAGAEKVADVLLGIIQSERP